MSMNVNSVPAPSPAVDTGAAPAVDSGAAPRRLAPTPGQTVGPFFGYALPYAGGEELVPALGPRAVLLQGYVYDGGGDPVPDAVVEIWQADEYGRIPRLQGSLCRDQHTFTGFGRAATTAAGHYQFFTVIPGVAVETASDARQAGAMIAGATTAGARAHCAPFIAVAVFARGLTNKLHSRIYLPDYAELNAEDRFLTGLSEAERATITAGHGDDGSLVQDIYLQGEKETVFLAFG